MKNIAPTYGKKIIGALKEAIEIEHGTMAAPKISQRMIPRTGDLGSVTSSPAES